MNLDHEALAIQIANDAFSEMVFQKGRDYTVYLVGGNLRDIILGRPSRDRDFAVVGSPDALARRISNETGGKLVVLGKKHLFRIILSGGSTLDFSAAKDDIVTDLKQRDYTVNALGWSPESGMIDPSGGLDDMENRIVRMTSRDNLQKDPVRIIRGYRLAAELGFGIDASTREALRDLSPHLANSKSERITLEFFRILNLQKPSNILNSMVKDGVLRNIICNSHNALQEQPRVLSNIERIIDVLPLKHKTRLREIFSQNLGHSGLIYLQSLLWSASGMHLTLSSRILRHRRNLLAGQKIREKAAEEGRTIRESLYDLISSLGDAAEDYFILRGMPEFLSECERYRQIIRNGILSTGEITKRTGMQPGIELGRAIEVMRKGEFHRKFNKKSTALQFLLENYPAL